MIPTHGVQANDLSQSASPIDRELAAPSQDTRAPLGSCAYVSSAVTPLTVAALESLHRQAVASNRHNGITGVLLYNAGNFMQYLEGPQPELARLYARIQADARHRHVIELLNGPVPHRSFEQWHMGLAQATASDVLALSTASWQRLHDDPKSDPAQSQGLALLLAFWRQERN